MVRKNNYRLGLWDSSLIHVFHGINKVKYKSAFLKPVAFPAFFAVKSSSYSVITSNE